jgi:hypothetical protein
MHTVEQDNNEITAIDWNEISELGLLQRINREIMHPLGLALYRNVDDGSSSGALIADDGVWEYSPEITKKILSDDEVVLRVQQLLNQE